MRNNILVKNSVFYNSTVREDNAMEIVRAFNDIEHETINIHSNSLDMYVSNNYNGEVKASSSSLLVYNTLKTDKTDDLKGITVHIIDEIKEDIVEFIEPYPININVSDIRPFSILIQEKKEQEEQQLKGTLFNIFDKNQIIEMNHPNLYLKEFNIVQDNTNNIQTIKTCESKKYINNKSYMEGEECFLYCNTPASIVSKKCSSEYMIREEMSIIVKSNKKEEGYSNMPVLEINVTNTSNSTDIGSNNSGGDLKALMFTIQQMSFFEFKLKFQENKVRDVFNLPTGLFFDEEQQRIVGTPIQSGKYSFSVIFENGDTLSGSITVPKLNREL